MVTLRVTNTADWPVQVGSTTTSPRSTRGWSLTVRRRGGRRLKVLSGGSMDRHRRPVAEHGTDAVAEDCGHLGARVPLRCGPPAGGKQLPRADGVHRCAERGGEERGPLEGPSRECSEPSTPTTIRGLVVCVLSSSARLLVLTRRSRCGEWRRPPPSAWRGGGAAVMATFANATIVSSMNTLSGQSSAGGRDVEVGEPLNPDTASGGGACYARVEHGPGGRPSPVAERRSSCR